MPRKKRTKLKQSNFRLDIVTQRRLRDLAKHCGATLSEVVRASLELSNMYPRDVSDLISYHRKNQELWPSRT